jgi:hypothetical protein
MCFRLAYVLTENKKEFSMKYLRVIFIYSICLSLNLSIFAVDNSFKLDFDGDGSTDIALYREGSRSPDIAPQNSTWYFLNTNTNQRSSFQFGRTLDVPAPADFDNDGKTDTAVYRWWDFELGDVNQWWVNKSSGGSQVFPLEKGYNKYNRNYVGDGRAEIGQLYQINTGQIAGEDCFMSIYLILDLDYNATRKNVGDTCNVVPTPVPGDYDNNGRSEIAVFNNQTFKVWFPPYDSAYTTPNITQTLNVESPVPGDYDGDGKTDFAGIRTQSNRMLWVFKESSSGKIVEISFGFTTDKPAPGDYNGDGITDIAVFRPNEGSWWIRNGANGNLSLFYFGLPTDIPLAMPVIPFNPS